MISNNFAEYIRQKNKSGFNKPLMTLGIILILVSLITSQIVLPTGANADSPQFNIFTPYSHVQAYNQDYYLLDVKNETKGTGFNFPVSADPGDTLLFYVYYHNGIINTTATNTTLKISLPSVTASQQTITAYLWADNAVNASAANPLSQSVQVNISSPQQLQLVQGSVQWFPNEKNIQVDSPSALPNGQTGNELFGNGLNIGSIEGCWEFSGSVIFRAKVSAVQQINDLSITKTVRNITAGQTSFIKNANANNGDRLMFQLQTNNTGNTVLNNVFVRDSLPSGLNYVAGSTRVDGSSASDGIASGGLSVGTLNVGAARQITFEATIGVSASSGSQTLTNTGLARADQVAEKSDTASVNVAQQVISLTIDKQMKNVTNNDPSFAKTVSAAPRQTLAVQLTVRNTGTTNAGNVFVRDVLPDRLLYTSGSTKIDGVSAGDGITMGGISLGSLTAGQTKTVTFNVNIDLEVRFIRGVTNLTNTGFVRADNFSEVQDAATVIVTYAGCDPQQNRPPVR